MIQPQRSFQLLVVAFDPPVQFRQPNELLDGCVWWHRGQPELRGRRFPTKPFGHQPLNRAGGRSGFIPVGRANPPPTEARRHRAARAFSPGYRLPPGCRRVGGQFHNRGRFSGRAPSDSGWRATWARAWFRRQCRQPRRPPRRVAADAHDIRHLPLGQRIPEGGDHPVPRIRQRCQRSCNNPQLWSANSPHPLTEGGGRWRLTRRG